MKKILRIFHMIEKVVFLPWLVAQWIERQPANQRVSGFISIQGTWLGCGPGPWWGHQEATTH